MSARPCSNFASMAAPLSFVSYCNVSIRAFTFHRSTSLHGCVERNGWPSTDIRRMPFPILSPGPRISPATRPDERWDPRENAPGASIASGSSMTPRTSARLAWGIAIVSYAILAACLVLLWLNRAAIGSIGAGPVGNLVPVATLGALGALIASRRPANAVGWLMLFIAITVGVSLLAALIAIRALLVGVSPHGWVRWPAWVQNWFGNPALGGLILIFFLFPDGKVLSGRWRWVARLTVVCSIGFTAGVALDAAPLELLPHLPK